MAIRFSTVYINALFSAVLSGRTCNLGVGGKFTPEEIATALSSTQGLETFYRRHSRVQLSACIVQQPEYLAHL